MSETFRLYDLLDSPFCLKARICLALKQVPYERIPFSVARLPELRRLNALGKVPVLVANGRALADSSQIVRFLEDKFPKPPLLSKDPSARAYAHLIEEWADESLSFIIGAFKWLNPANRERAYAASAELAPRWAPKRLVLHLVRRQITRRYRSAGYGIASLGHLEERMAENLGYMADLLADKPFLLGRYVTLADIAAFAQLQWLSGYEEGRRIGEVPALQQWMERLAAVEPIQQAIRADTVVELRASDEAGDDVASAG